MISEKDVQKLIIAFSDIFPTKLELEEKIANLEEKFVTNERFDQAMGKLDFIIGELKTIREEQSAHVLRHDDLEKDIREIRALPSVAHQIKK